MSQKYCLPSVPCAVIVPRMETMLLSSGPSSSLSTRSKLLLYSVISARNFLSDQRSLMNPRSPLLLVLTIYRFLQSVGLSVLFFFYHFASESLHFVPHMNQTCLPCFVWICFLSKLHALERQLCLHPCNSASVLMSPDPLTSCCRLYMQCLLVKRLKR